MGDFTLGDWNPNISALPDVFGAASTFGARPDATAYNTIDTVPSNAVQSMAPVSDAGANSWAGFWQDTIKGVIGYATARDAAQVGLTRPGMPLPAGGRPAVGLNVGGASLGISPGMLLLLGIGAAVLLKR